MPTRVPTFSPPMKVVDHGRDDRQKLYGTAAWRKLRKQFIREHPLCEFINHPVHGFDCQRASSQVDHRLPVAKGGAELDETNLRALCPTCHSKITRNYRATGVNEMAKR